jgi:phenylpropionate dioxygenase-like ring-hydroxylating dioxygenase large terminal subunit
MKLFLFLSFISLYVPIKTLSLLPFKLPFKITKKAIDQGIQNVRNIIKNNKNNQNNIVSKESRENTNTNSTCLEDQKKLHDENYNLHWYVIGESDDFVTNKLYRITIWNNDYVFLKDRNGHYYAMDDACTHRGASLSRGTLNNQMIVCPYHGYEFNKTGTLCKVPGIHFINTPCQNQVTYNMAEKNGWVYLNTINTKFYNPSKISIFEEPEANNKNFTYIKLNMGFNAYSRIVSENSLDVMHIGFVHTFGNKERPNPINETPPFLLDDYPYHYKTIYHYQSGKDSMAKKIFLMDELIIENEFVLPHTTIARVIFGEYTSTVVTFATPINLTHSTLFVKTYRNFWYVNNNSNFISNLYNKLGDYVTKKMMTLTVFQDKAVVENIKIEKMEGTFNMQYDKLQNVYRQFYKKLIHTV